MSDAAIHCPACGEAMNEVTAQGLTLDRCPECSGIYFDSGELAAAARCMLPPLQVKSTSERPCPRCRTKMKLAVFGPAVVDWCEPCRGLFMHADQFRAVRKGRPPISQDPSGRRVDSEKDGYEVNATWGAVAFLGVMLGGD